MESETWSRPTLPNESVPPALHQITWIEIYLAGLHLHDTGVRPQVQNVQVSQSPSNYGPPNYMLSPPDPWQARRSEISSPYQSPIYAAPHYVNPSSLPQHPAQPPGQPNQFWPGQPNTYPNEYPINGGGTSTPIQPFASSGNAPWSPSTGNAIGRQSYHNQGGWHSNQHTNSPQLQSDYRYLPASPAIEQPIDKRAVRRRRKAAAREARSRQQQQGPQAEPENRRRAQVRGPPGQAEITPRRNERALWAEPQVIGPGRPSPAPSSVLDWTLDLVDAIQSRPRSRDPATDAPTSRDPRRLYRPPTHEAGPTSSQGVPGYIRPRPPVPGSYSPDDDSDDDMRVRSEERASPLPPLESHRVSHIPFPTVHQDRKHTQRNASTLAQSPCSICSEVPKKFPKPTANCTHASTICASCLEQYISHAVLSQGSTTLTCPDPECRKTMEYADIVRSAKDNKACLNRYEALLLQRTLEKDPNFVRCKNPNCGSGQLHEGGAAAPIVICQACQARSCFTHDMPWHSGLTCEEYTAQRAEKSSQDQASQAYLDKNAKICPNPSCGRRIEKSDGCDHMTCRRPAGCGHEFCWLCLADYGAIFREGNHRHDPSCRHYAGIGYDSDF